MTVPILLIAGIIVILSLSVHDDAFGAIRESKNVTEVTQLNEYSNYVHFQPEWNSYPRNLIIEVSASWHRQIIPGDEAMHDMSKHGAKQRQNTLQYVNGKPVVAVQYDYHDCQSQWFHYTKTGLDFLGDRFFKKESIPNTAYADEEQIEKLRGGFAQFVPICTSKNSTNFEYDVSINDDAIGFDVYFVPSEIQQLNYFLYDGIFEYYEERGCSANNFKKLFVTCKNVDKSGGLLIVIPDKLSRPMTKISLNLTEK